LLLSLTLGGGRDARVFFSFLFSFLTLEGERGQGAMGFNIFHFLLFFRWMKQYARKDG